VSIAAALADKIDSVTAFFAAGEQPTGSGDPFALRRAALGIIRIIRENRLRLELLKAIRFAQEPFADVADAVFAFAIDRLRVQLRTDGARHDVLAAVFAAGADDDLTRLLARTDAVTFLLAQPDGANLLAAYRRAANILRIEDRRDGPHEGPPEASLFEAAEERALAAALDQAEPRITAAIAAEDFDSAMVTMAGLRGSLDAFFDSVTVNAASPELRRNRLRLLRRITGCMDHVADFAKIDS
jgi:glycyl-tRNA synthetase beta chain